MGITIIPHLTTALRDTIPTFLRVTGLRIFNITTNTDERWNGSAWVAVSSGGSFTPVPYQADPTDSDAGRQAWLIAFRNNMVTAGQMAQPPTYVVSGQVTGSVQNGISIELRDNGTNTLLETVVTNVSGNYAFTARVAGTYKVQPIFAGHYFTPSAPVIILSSNTTQNFVSAVGVESSEVSSTHVLAFSSGAARAMKKSPRALESGTFPNITAAAYGVLFTNGRWFVPVFSAGSIFVYEEVGGVFTLKATINTASMGIGNPYRVFVKSNGKMAVVGSSLVRFGTYNNATETFTASGAGAINFGVSMTDAVCGDGKIYLVSTFGGTPSRNLTIIDIGTEAITTQNVAAFAGSPLAHIGFGDGKLYVGTGTSGAVIDATTFVQVGSTIALGANQNGRTAFAQGRFWVAHGVNLRHILAADASTALTTFTSAPAPGSLHGAVADANFVYAADNSGTGRLFTVNPATAVEDGTALPILAGGIVYLKN